MGIMRKQCIEYRHWWDDQLNYSLSWWGKLIGDNDWSECKPYLDKIVLGFPQKQKLCMEFRYIYRLSNEEIGRKFKPPITEAAVRKQIEKSRVRAIELGRNKDYGTKEKLPSFRAENKNSTPPPKPEPCPECAKYKICSKQALNLATVCAKVDKWLSFYEGYQREKPIGIEIPVADKAYLTNIFKKTTGEKPKTENMRSEETK